MVDIFNQSEKFKAFEVTFIDKNQELQKIICTVKNVEYDNIIIEANNKQNKNITANVENEFKLYIYTENGIYSAVSRVLHVNKEDSTTKYTISYPKNVKHSQRREYFRAEIPLNFKIEVIPNDSSENIIIEGKTKNICGKGMSYVSNLPFPENNSIKISLFFEEITIDTLSTHVYSKQITVGKLPIFVHAFTFTSIEQKDIDFIVKKCFLYQLELRKTNKI